MNTFEERCLRDPQGVIQDLLQQTKAQALEIHECFQVIRELSELRVPCALTKAVSLKLDYLEAP